MSEKTPHTGRAVQIRIYTGKLFRIFFHEKDWKMLIFAGLIAALVSYVVGDRMFVNMEGTKIGSLAFVCVCIWNGFFNSIQSVCKERSIIKREHRTGLHITSYITAHMIYQSFLCASQTLIMMAVYGFCGVTYPNAGLISGNFYVDFFITLFLITYASAMMGLMVSCIVRTTTSAMTVMPFLLIIQLVFAGIAFPLHGKAALLSNATISKWGIYAVCTEANYNALPSDVVLSQLNHFRDIELVDAVMDQIPQDTIRYFTAQHMQAPEYDYETSNILKEWGILLGFALLYALIGTGALELIDHDKR